MILPRPDGSGFFITERPDRTYKTERGARQARRMFQHPELWHGWTREGREQADALDALNAIIEVTENIINNETGLDLDLNDNEEDNFFEPIEIEEEEEEEEEEGHFINWYNIPLTLRRMISELLSNSACKERLLSNGWAGVYLSDIIADFGEDVASDYFPEYFE